MGKNEQRAGKSTRGASKKAGQDARRAGDMKQAMAGMIGNCGCCEGMKERLAATHRARRTPDSAVAKA